MSLNRRNPRRDSVEPLIVETLQRRGFHVDRVSAPGFPDLVISKIAYKATNGWTPSMWLAEVKRPRGKYTAKQIEWRGKFQGPTPYCLRSVEDAIAFPERRAVATDTGKPSQAVPPSKPKTKNTDSPTRRRRA